MEDNNFNAHKYGREFEDKLIEWFRGDSIESVNSEDLYGKASESVESAVKNKERGDVLITGTPVEIDCKRNYFIDKKYDSNHPFDGWFALTNDSMDKDKTIFVHSRVIKKWIDQRLKNTDPKWDISVMKNEGIRFDPEYRPLRASISFNDFIKKIKNESKTISS